MSAETTPLLTVKDLTVSFKKGRQVVQAVAGISFEVYEGETLGLVGESGCGKSTTGRAIVRIEEPTAGEVAVDGTILTGLSRGELRRARTSIQMIFQDPVSSLNPRRRVKDIVARPRPAQHVPTPFERCSKRLASIRRLPASDSHASSQVGNASASASLVLW